jgi:hypothetical protein
VVLLEDTSLVILSALEAIRALIVGLKSSTLPSSLTTIPILKVSLAFFSPFLMPKACWFKDEHLIGTAYTLCVDAENSGRVF